MAFRKICHNSIRINSSASVAIFPSTRCRNLRSWPCLARRGGGTNTPSLQPVEPGRNGGGGGGETNALHRITEREGGWPLIICYTCVYLYTYKIYIYRRYIYVYKLCIEIFYASILIYYMHLCKYIWHASPNLIFGNVIQKGCFSFVVCFFGELWLTAFGKGQEWQEEG